MSVRRRRLRSLRATSFATLDQIERINWYVSGPMIGGTYTPRDAESTYVPTIWPTWAAWADVYTACRTDFLASIAADEPTPAAERIFIAYKSGGDAAANNVSNVIGQELQDEQRRLYAEVFGR